MHPTKTSPMTVPVRTTSCLEHQTRRARSYNPCTALVAAACLRFKPTNACPGKFGAMHPDVLTEAELRFQSSVGGTRPAPRLALVCVETEAQAEVEL